MAEKTGDSSDRSDNGKHDIGKAMIPRFAPEFQECESVDKENDAYVKEDNAGNVGILLGNIEDNSKEESNPIVKEGTSISITDGLDDSNSNEIPLTRPKSIWTRFNRMDFGLSGFTKSLVLPTLGKREANQKVM